MTDKSPPDLVSRARGALYCFLWYSSIFFGFFFLVAPCLPLLIIHRRLYRRITDTIFTIWESYSAALLEAVFGMKTFVTGDAIRSDETSIIICNHRTRVDWNFLWCALLHSTTPATHSTKFVLKDQVKQIPAVGWIMQMCRFLYIDRCWKSDQERMGQMLEHLAKVSKQEDGQTSVSGHYQLLLFPEGTNLTKKTRAKSDEFAAKTNQKPLKHLLHPRTTGFSYLAGEMRKNGNLDAIYDVTIAYPDNLPETEADLANGSIPSEIHFHIKRHSVQTVPTTWIGLEKWLQEVWREKDALLENVYDRRLKLPALTSRQHLPQPILPIQWVSLVAFTCFIYWSLSITLFVPPWVNWRLWAWLLSTGSLMGVVSKYTQGIQHAEALLENSGLVGSIKRLCFAPPEEESSKKEE